MIELGRRDCKEVNGTGKKTAFIGPASNCEKKEFPSGVRMKQTVLVPCHLPPPFDLPERARNKISRINSTVSKKRFSARYGITGFVVLGEECFDKTGPKNQP